MRLLVTGGAGFIGSNLVWSLSDDHEILVVDDLSTGKIDNLPVDVEVRRLDVLDPELMRIVNSFCPHAIVHLAAQASVSRSLADPQLDWAVNVEGTRAVALAAAAAGVQRVLSASSAAVYGNPSELPLTESAQKLPESPYGHSKLAAELALSEELSRTNVDFASLRFSNVYGPRQDAQGEGGVVAVFCDAMARGEAPTIFGSGLQTRDFVYVGDVVNAISTALSFEGALREGAGTGPAYNISTGSRVSVRDLADNVAELAGLDVSIPHAPAREGDIMHSALDPHKARAVFGWDARTPLRRGLVRTYEWFAESSA